MSSNHTTPETRSAPESRGALESRDALLTRMVHQYARLLYRVAFAVLRHPEDAEDAVQDALLKLYRTAELPALQNETAFLARTVWRAALDRLAVRRDPRHALAADPAAELQFADGRPSPEAEASDAAEQALLRRWIAELPDDLRQPLLLSAVEGLNSRQAAEILGLPEGTIRTRLMRAREKLRERFAAHTLPRHGRPEVAAVAERTTR